MYPNHRPLSPTSQVGGLNIALQDELDANEKMFVGGQHLRDLADLGGKVAGNSSKGEAETYHVLRKTWAKHEVPVVSWK